MKLRQGRRNPLTLYVQMDDQPADDDPCLGLVLDQHAAAILCRLANDWVGSEIGTQQRLLGAMATQLLNDAS